MVYHCTNIKIDKVQMRIQYAMFRILSKILATFKDDVSEIIDHFIVLKRKFYVLYIFI